ncbi:MipA/OmpV family protein [Burkholderia sp. WAC0059]|uniref:MipA/OmpV family protein n=1 Tax=Burkholderia sp. WAC0059 TaxID=2066022 RepID=UPI000C7ED431|nr:MipA/OmpV family protein [Burkholderia sp. WAC0059]PLZ00768.1 MipA/OmpV family protein [Burkholderia sp. WAC0059]
MVRFTAHRYCPLALLAATLALAPAVRAEGNDTSQSGNNGNPFVLLNNSINVTQWGLGAGVNVRQSIYRGYSARVTPIPILYFDDKWIRFTGTTLDLKILNMNAGSWGNVLMSLRGTYDLEDGYRGTHAAALNGMQNRDGAFWYGPALEWRTAFGTLNTQFLTGENKGQRASLEFEHAFRLAGLTVSPHIGAEWLSHDYADYYYDVRPSEARPGRDAYTGTASYVVSAGARADYSLTPHQTVSLDLGVSRFGSGVTDSPIVNRKTSPEATLDYFYRF